MVKSHEVPEPDHSLNTVQKKGASVSHQHGGRIPYAAAALMISIRPFTDSILHQISQTCLVPSRRLVRAARKLEGEHSGDACDHGGDMWDCVECECGEGGPI